MLMCYNLNVCTNYAFLLPVCIFIKCFWFAHVSNLEGKGCAHAHTNARACVYAYARAQTVILIW